LGAEWISAWQKGKCGRAAPNLASFQQTHPYEPTWNDPNMEEACFVFTSKPTKAKDGNIVADFLAPGDQSCHVISKDIGGARSKANLIACNVYVPIPSQ